MLILLFRANELFVKTCERDQYVYIYMPQAFNISELVNAGLHTVLAKLSKMPN